MKTVIKNNFFDTRLIHPGPLSSTGELLTQFAECALFTFSAKDIKTRKIFIHNKTCAELYGLDQTGLVGMTSRDCLSHIKPFAHKESALSRWEAEEIKAVTNDQVQTSVITILDHAGFIRTRQHLTIPVHGDNKQIVAIAAFCYDRTAHVDLLNLFKQYQKYYSKTKAIVQISKYLQLEDFFQLQLTAGEMYTLLALVQAPKHKQAAQLLSMFREKVMASTTISGYVDSIKDKLQSSIDLDTVLSHLRGLNQWIPDPDIF